MALKMASGKKLILYLIIFMLTLLTGLGAFYYLIIVPSQVLIDAGEKIVESISETFNFSPRVTNKNTVIFEEQAAILEVAIYSQRLVHDFEHSSTWMGSTKELHLRGVYLAKYGFNLKRQVFSINLAKDDSVSDPHYHITFNMPEPILLSFEIENYRIIQDQDGWWNKFTKTEREIAVNRLQGAAREKALSIDYRNKVRESIELQFRIMMIKLPLEIPIGTIDFVWQDKNFENIHIQDNEVRLR